MKRLFPPAPELGPCPMVYKPVEVDDAGMETAIPGSKPESCPGKLRQMANADGAVCDACYTMVPIQRKKERQLIVASH